jgi:hypothetical protein
MSWYCTHGSDRFAFSTERGTSPFRRWRLRSLVRGWAVFFLSLFHFGTLVDDPVPFDTAVDYLVQRVAVSVDALSASKQSTKSV